LTGATATLAPKRGGRRKERGKHAKEMRTLSLFRRDSQGGRRVLDHPNSFPERGRGGMGPFSSMKLVSGVSF